MGYNTDFEGRIEINPPLNAAEIWYLQMFAETRHMCREQGEYYVDGTWGQNEIGVIPGCYNTPPSTQPSLWCNFCPTDDGTALVWNEAEKTKQGEQWIHYLIENFLQPNATASNSGSDYFTEFTFNHQCNGVLRAYGEDHDDRWKIVVTNNLVSRAEMKEYDSIQDILTPMLRAPHVEDVILELMKKIIERHSNHK